jgi:hypothetical protein
MATTAKLPRPMRLNQRAQLVPTASFDAWHTIASATPGLTDLDRKLLDGLCEHHRRLHVEGYAGRLSIETLALGLNAVPRDVRASISRLIGLALIGVKPGAGARASEYLLALPKRVVAVMARAAAEDEPAPPF